MGAKTTQPETRATLNTCALCQSSVIEELVTGIAGNWWRYRCTGCGMAGNQHSEKDHRRHVRLEERAADRRRRADRPAARWYLDRDEREGA